MCFSLVIKHRRSGTSLDSKLLFQYWRTDRSQETTKGKLQLDAAGTAGILVTILAQGGLGWLSQQTDGFGALSEPVISIRAEFLLFFRSSSLYKTALSRHKKRVSSIWRCLEKHHPPISVGAAPIAPVPKGSIF